MAILIIGILAGTLCTVSFVPQVVKIYRSKDAKSLSLWTFAIFLSGVFLWLIYGMLIRELPIIIANLATLILVLLVMLMKIRYK